MTTALIGTKDSACATARVGLVLPHGTESIATSIAHAGHETFTCKSWDELAEQTSDRGLDIVFCHESCVESIPAQWSVPVVCMDDNGDISEQALPALLAFSVELATQADRLGVLESVVSGICSGSAMVGNTPPMRRLQAAVSRAADGDATVLIEGPVGSGKSMAARAVHLKSRRSTERLVARDCATLTGEGLGRALAECKQTTLVLEEVDQLSAAAQSVLVKHLKERSTSRAPTLARLIATTSAHIPELVARGAFREDLYYRLHMFPVMVPGLQERVDDIPALADSILNAGVSESGHSHRGFTPAARTLLKTMQWPGHVAQLEVTVRRGQLLAGGAPVDRDHLLAPTQGAHQQSSPTSVVRNEAVSDVELTEDSIRPFEEEEKHLLGRALQATKGNVRRAAQLLGIGRATLYRKIQQYQLRLH